LLDLGLGHGQVAKVGAVVGLDVVPPWERELLLLVPKAGRHREQMPDRDSFEPRIAVYELGQVLGDRVLDALDQPLVDRDPDERRDERLRHGERGLQRLSVGAPDIPLVDQPIRVDARIGEF
jgi:hypothetical protein